MEGRQIADGTMRKALKILAVACRLILGTIFLWAGMAKLLDPWVFAEGMRSFNFFPETSVHLIAISFPFLESTTGLLLLLNLWVRPASLVAALLSLCFLWLFARSAYHGWSVHCGCFGRSFGELPSAWAIIRSMVLFALAGTVFTVAFLADLGKGTSQRL